MKSHWMLQTHGDPLGTIQTFLGEVWRRAALTGMLAPLHVPGGAGVTPRLMRSPDQLLGVDPCAPVMASNSASLVAHLARERPNERLGVVLRPCEVRTLVEISKRGSFTLDRLLIIGVDCLATCSVDEYTERAEAAGGVDRLTHETLQSARDRGVVPHHYRRACRICTAPVPEEVDLSVGILGLATRRLILVTARADELVDRLRLDAISEGVAPEAFLEAHAWMRSNLAAQRTRSRERMLKALATDLPADVDGLVTLLESCAPCQECMDACPIFVDDPLLRVDQGTLSRDDLSRWLVSCVGCGMCEEACPQDRPLTLIFNRINQQLAGAFDYTPGRSVSEKLPLAG